MKIILALLAPLLMAQPALAGDASEVLAKMDRAMSASEDLYLRYDVVNQEPGKKEPRNMAFTTKVKGEKSLTEFEAPADLKGTRVLVMSRSQMYVYLPAYRKVRRIASHVTQQGFMGTTYSHDDMSSAPLGEVYQAVKLVEETDTQWQIELAPKAETTAPYPKAVLTVDKKMKQPTVLKYFNDKDVNIKTETRTDFSCEGEVCVPGLLRMEDHTRNGAWTEMRRTEYKINPGFSADVFTTRYLQRGS
jgi:outer membrane lipoprotein-sorting protein